MDRSTTAAGNGAAGKSQIPAAGRETSSASRTDAQSARPTAQSSTASSVTSSPLPSRETSPTRSLRASIAAARNPPSGVTGPGNRSRKNSQQDLSPSRPPKSSASATTTVPTSKSISAATTPTLLPVATADASNIKAPIPQKSPATLEHLRDTPRWPVSPRLKSPPPLLNKPNLGPSRKGDHDQTTPTINLQRPTPPMNYPDTPSQSDAELDDGHLQSGTRTPARGSTSTLETVQEASPLGSPHAVNAALERLEDSLISDTSSQADASEVPGGTAPARVTKTRQALVQSHNESGSDSGSVKAERRPGATSAPPPSLTSRQSSTSTITKPAAGKGKPSEGTVKTMTVETETVTSIPQVAVAPTSMQGTNGSLRTKPSSETIRPKKEKKKPSKKQQAIQSNAASSKADNFEAKIASAVDEADTSDSEETFVYDSNPPDGRDRPLTNRFHSRTPSATSMVSQVDRNGMRSIHSVMEGGGGGGGGGLPGGVGATVMGGVMPSSTGGMKKKKFSNTFTATSGTDSGFGGDDEGGPARGGHIGSSRGTTPRHPAHIGLWGRNGGGGNGHTYLFDSESPFIGGSSRGRPSPHVNSASGGMRQSPGPPSPRFVAAGGRGGGLGVTGAGVMGSGGGGSGGGGGGGGSSSKRGSQSGYDLDDTTTGADDEHTPLIPSSLRSSRSRRSTGGSGLNAVARYHHSLAVSGRGHPGAAYHSSSHHPQSLLNRMASCLVLTVMLLLVVSGAIGFMFATSQPLTNVELVKIANVIASEQELMFDMTVKAQNPNVVVVVVDSSDLEIFAKSQHAGTDGEWWRRPSKPRPSRPGLEGNSGSFAARRAAATGMGQREEEDDEDGIEVEEVENDWQLINGPRPLDALSPPPDDSSPPLDDTAPNMRLGTIRELDQPFSFEGSFFNKGSSVSRGSLRLNRPGNGTESGAERWSRILEDEFDLILKGVLKYSLPMSQRVRTIAISGRTRVKPNSATNPGDDEDDGDGDGDGGGKGDKGGKGKDGVGDGDKEAKLFGRRVPVRISGGGVSGAGRLRSASSGEGEQVV